MTRSVTSVRIAILVAIVAIAFVLGWSLRGGGGSGTMAPDAGSVVEATVWTCSMHPQIQLPQPGACPICGMDLIPLETEGIGDADAASLTLSPAAQKLAEIETAPAVRAPLETELRLTGKLEPSEPRIRQIAARVPGRIDRLHADYEGMNVRRGESLFDLYSPELYSAQEELLQVLGGSPRNVEAARQRLRLWGLSEEQVEEIVSRGTPSQHVTFRSPISGTVLELRARSGSYVETGTPLFTLADLSVLWLQVDVYESDLAWVREGARVAFTTESIPGETLEGEVTFVDPVVDPRTRSVKVRVEIANPEHRLKPGFFVRAVVRARYEGDDDREPLVIPATAPLYTGTRAVVYVADPAAPGRFHGREVVLGPESGDRVVVLRGLREGERVVSNGAFKIDSALQIQARPSMMSPGERPPGLDVGGDTGARPLAEVEPLEDLPEPPAAFRTTFDRVLARYFETSTALSLDSLASARAAAAKLPADLQAVDASALSDSARDRWLRAASELERLARAIANAEQIEDARDLFFGLSERMIHTVRLFDPSGDVPVYVYHCPMARQGSGADWIQLRKGTENPYYGSQMYRCGSLTEVVAGPEDADGASPGRDANGRGEAGGARDAGHEHRGAGDPEGSNGSGSSGR